MKTFSSAMLANFGLSLTGLTLAASVAAQPFSVVYDTDGKYRSSTYNGSFIERITTTTDSAQNFQFYIYPSDDFTGSCVSANAYDIQTGAHIGNAPIYPLGHMTNFLVVNLPVDEASAQNDKLIAMHCYNNDGDTVEVQHKVPGAPTIEWTSNLEGIGQWNSTNNCGGPNCQPGFGSYDKLAYSATIKVNNNSSESRCFTEQDADLTFGLLNGNFYRNNFYSDTFATNTEIREYTPPVIMQKVTCMNSGGTTKAIQVWEVASEEFELVEDSSYSY